MLLRALPLIIEVGLLVYCLVDCVQTPDDEIRNLPKGAWILLIVLLPLAGGIAWLVAGRPSRQGGSTPYVTGFPETARAPRPPRPPMGPDDDPEFLRGLDRVDVEHEEILQRWEADLARREEEMRRRESRESRENGDGPTPT